MSKDTIYREDAINFCEKWRSRTNEHHDKNGWYIADTLLKAIKELPSADRPQETCMKEAEILLKATRNLLNKQNESIFVLNMLAETVTYYGVECDGSCLIEDIDAWLELYGSKEGADNENA